MFNIFINNLIDDIKSLNIGIDIDGEKIAILYLIPNMSHIRAYGFKFTNMNNIS